MYFLSISYKMAKKGNQRNSKNLGPGGKQHLLPGVPTPKPILPGVPTPQSIPTNYNPSMYHKGCGYGKKLQITAKCVDKKSSNPSFVIGSSNPVMRGHGHPQQQQQQLRTAVRPQLF